RRNLACDEHARHRRRVEIGGVGVPDAAEVDVLVGELEDRNDLGMLVEAFDERILDGIPEAPREGEELRGREVTITKEDDEMLEPGAPEQRVRRIVERLPQVDTR